MIKLKKIKNNGVMNNKNFQMPINNQKLNCNNNQNKLNNTNKILLNYNKLLISINNLQILCKQKLKIKIINNNSYILKKTIKFNY